MPFSGSPSIGTGTAPRTVAFSSFRDTPRLQSESASALALVQHARRRPADLPPFRGSKRRTRGVHIDHVYTWLVWKKSQSATARAHRVNISLPKETVQLLSRVSRGNRSRFIDQAIRHLVASQAKAHLRRRLKEGYLRNAESLRLAEEWFPSRSV
jgi:hypothetical protein